MIKSRRMRWVGCISRMGGRKLHIGYCLENQMEMITKCRRVDCIKMDFTEIVWGGMD
jgi:hypothetical protein